jgi:hypothetical protein
MKGQDLFRRQLSWSVFGVFLVFTVIVYHGAKLTVFLLKADQVDDILNKSSDSVAMPAGVALKSFVANWKNEPGVAELVRRQALAAVGAERTNDKAAIESAISAIVEYSPTSDATWQNLAEARLARGAPIESVLAAFRMSGLTGSHELASLVGRATFGLEHWSELPDQDRRTVIRDLLRSVENHSYEIRYRKILAAKSEIERDSIRAALLSASGFASEGILQALGV